MTLRFVPGATGSSSSVAFAIGRDVGGAVARNRARRRLRAVLAARADTLAPGSYCFSGSAELVTCPFAVLDECMGELLDALPRPA